MEPRPQPQEEATLAERIADLEDWKTKGAKTEKLAGFALRLSIIGTLFAIMGACATVTSAYYSSRNAAIVARTYEAQMMPHVIVEATQFSINNEEISVALKVKNSSGQPAYKLTLDTKFVVGGKEMAVNSAFPDESQHKFLPPASELVATSWLSFNGVKFREPLMNGAVLLEVVLDFSYENVNNQKQNHHYKCRYLPKNNTCAIVYYN